MNRNRRNKHNSNWNNQNKNNNNGNQQKNQQKKFEPSRQFASHEDESVLKEKQKAIQELKNKEVICSKCGQVITEVTSALCDKATGNPVHFECALSDVEKNETLAQNEKIADIGQGRFGVISYENPRDQRHFTIKKIIEWEDRDTKSEWRKEISELYSKVN